jgi:hypothetical protein
VRRYLRSIPALGIQIIHVTDARIFADQGYEVTMEWRRRLGLEAAAPDRTEYLAAVEQRINDVGWVVLAGMSGDQMLGYMTGWAVGPTAYLHENHVMTEALRLGLSDALDFAAIQVFIRAGVTEVTSGVHIPEQPGWTTFKIRQGFPVVHLPTRVWMQRPAENLLRLGDPYRYYRLTGRRVRNLAGPIPGGDQPLD